MKYRCKHYVEALRWREGAENREVFAKWFKSHNEAFVTRNSVVILPEEGEVQEGDWVVYSDGEFIIMDDESFKDTYEFMT